MNSKIRIVLVEDNKEYSEVIRLVLEGLSDMELTGQFGTSEFALRTLRAASPPAPNIILLDLRLPGRSGLDSLSDFRHCVPDAKIIVLTQSDREQDILRAISLGASGYLLKSAKLDQITSAIRTVATGGSSLGSDVARFILEALQSKFSKDVEEPFLTERELEILSLLADGLVKKEIAKRLDIGYTTVDTHVGRIYTKLDVTNAPSAVHKAHLLRIFPPKAEEGR